MHNPIAQTNNLAPLHIRVVLSEFTREISTSFTNNLHLAKDSILQKSVLEEFVLGNAVGILFDALD
jgi:hypothetical protein